MNNIVLLLRQSFDETRNMFLNLQYNVNIEQYKYFFNIKKVLLKQTTISS